MNFSQIFLLLGVLLATFIDTVVSLHCYQCHSSESGCGKEVNIRLQRWVGCQSPGTGGGENFCVKVIEKRGSEEYITRGCLLTFKRHSEHRLRMPTVQRHGYCEPARNDDPGDPFDETRVYCFCNDWNGCNPASTTRATISLTTAFGLIAAMLVRNWL